jgi:3,6-diketocamphane 1,6-monooxygenase
MTDQAHNFSMRWSESRATSWRRFLFDRVFVVGSPDTVVSKLNALFEEVGGWGTLQIESHDYYDDPRPWFHSLELAAKEVAPRIKLPQKG